MNTPSEVKVFPVGKVRWSADKDLNAEIFTDESNWTRCLLFTSSSLVPENVGAPRWRTRRSRRRKKRSWNNKNENQTQKDESSSRTRSGPTEPEKLEKNGAESCWLINLQGLIIVFFRRVSCYSSSQEDGTQPAESHTRFSSPQSGWNSYGSANQRAALTSATEQTHEPRTLLFIGNVAVLIIWCLIW